MLSPAAERQNFKRDGLIDHASALFFFGKVILIGARRCEKFSLQSEQTDSG